MISPLPCAENPPVHLLNIFLRTVLHLIFAALWGQRCSFIHNWPSAHVRCAEPRKEAPGRVHICPSQLSHGEQCAVYPSLTLYELTICFIIGTNCHAHFEKS